MNDLGLITHLRRLAKDYANDPRIDPRMWDAIASLEARLFDRKPLYLHPDERHDSQLILDYLVLKTRSRTVLRPTPYDFAKQFTGKTARGEVEFIESKPAVTYKKGNNHGKPNRN